MVKITFPDGNTKEFDNGVTGKDVALSISEGLARVALAVKVNGKMIDVTAPITSDAEIQIITFKDPEGVDLFRHSTAHLLAHAIKRLYPEAKPTIGPAVEEGFYYDFDDLKITLDDFDKIEEEMKKIVKEELEPSRIEYKTKEEALEVFKNNPYKAEMIQNLEEGLSAYQQGDFVDLCRGPHIPNTKMIKAFKLTKLAGAYWRADAKNKQLTRVYGISFPDKKMLKQHLHQLEEAKKRDHRKIGKEMELYTVAEEIGPGLVMWLPKGNRIKEALENWAKETESRWGYQRVTTPMITKEGLFHTSEHLPHYKDSMFAPMDIDGEKYYIKPMNCPFHHTMFKTRSRSYRELPLRLAEYGRCHRYEQSGAVSGMLRVRAMEMNDAHIYCTKEQAVKEFIDVIKLHEYYYKTLGITDFWMELALRDPTNDKYHGDDAMWEEAEKLTRDAMEQSGVKYTVAYDGAAFYGPKIDFQIKSVIGQTYTISTSQIDLFMPKKFGLKYSGEDGKEHMPVCIHRAPLGTHERFVGFLIEHFSGKFPLWLSPNQVTFLPIADRHIEYCEGLATEMRALGMHVEVDTRSESTKKKVRDAQLNQFNYIIVVGDQEVEKKTVNIRTRRNQVLGEKDAQVFIKELLDEIQTKRIDEEELNASTSEE